MSDQGGSGHEEKPPGGEPQDGKIVSGGNRKETTEETPTRTVGRPRKAERDRGISIFLNQNGLQRIRAHAAALQAGEIAEGKTPVGINAFHSAALRAVIDRGWPDTKATSGRGDHANTNVVVNFYMSRSYLEYLDGFVAQVRETERKDYNRSMAIRDLIDLHLPE